jgi:hypothetical protein
MKQHRMGLSMVELLVAIGLASFLLVGLSRIMAMISNFWLQSEQILTVDQFETIIEMELAASAFLSAYAQKKDGELLNPMLARCAGVLEDELNLVLNRSVPLCRSAVNHPFVLAKRLKTGDTPLGLHQREGYALTLIAKGLEPGKQEITGTLYSSNGSVCRGETYDNSASSGSKNCPFEVRTGFVPQCPGREKNVETNCRVASAIEFRYEIRAAQSPSGERYNIPGSGSEMAVRHGTYHWASGKGDIEVKIERASSSDFMNCLWIQQDPEENPTVLGCSSDGALQPPYSPSLQGLDNIVSTRSTHTGRNQINRENFLLPLVFSVPQFKTLKTRSPCEMRAGFYTFVPSANQTGQAEICLTGSPGCTTTPSRANGQRLSGAYAITLGKTKYGPVPFDNLSSLLKQNTTRLPKDCPYDVQVCRVTPSYLGMIRVKLSDGRHCDKEATYFNNFVATIKYDTESCQMQNVAFESLPECP